MSILFICLLLIVWFYGGQFAFWFFNLFIRHRQNKIKKYLGENGGDSWAVVTGATAGIGLAFCEELLNEGFNLIMISRSSQKLSQIQQELSARWPHRQIVTFPWEASESQESDGFPDKLSQFIEQCLINGNRKISILVNNVGTTESTFGWFSDLGTLSKEKEKEKEKGGDRMMSEFEHIEDIKRTIKTNCLFPSKLTSALIPFLNNTSTSTASAIINVSSILAHLPSPFNPIYGATKAFNRTFSRALTAEYAEKGIDVLCVSPGMVTSNLTGMKKATWYCATAAETARFSLRALGAAVEIFPHPIHGFTYTICCLANTFLPAKIVATTSALALRFLPKPPGINVARDFRKH